MRVLSIHNYYRQRGGEDIVFEDEARLLEGHGHTVIRYTAHNDDTAGLRQVALAGRTVWNKQTSRELSEIIERERPDVAHVHNTLAMISPSAHHAARRAGVAVVQTLHNYRLMCPGVSFLRDGKVCEDCLGRRLPWPGVRHGCYHESRTATATVAAMVATHAAIGTWERQVDRYIAPTRFLRDKFIEGGFAAEPITVKPHFVSADPGPGDGNGGAALYVGRLSEEKGLRTLLAAWEHAPLGARLQIVGDGPLADVVASAAHRLDGVEWLGSKDRAAVQRLMGDARLLVAPSECFEAFGLVIIEALSVGTPVLASRIGPYPELIRDGMSGRLFRSGDSADLAAQIRWFFERPAEVQEMRRHARAEYQANYTAEGNYALLLDVYSDAMGAVPR